MKLHENFTNEHDNLCTRSRLHRRNVTENFPVLPQIRQSFKTADLYHQPETSHGIEDADSDRGRVKILTSVSGQQISVPVMSASSVHNIACSTTESEGNGWKHSPCRRLFTSVWVLA